MYHHKVHIQIIVIFFTKKLCIQTAVNLNITSDCLGRIKKVNDEQATKNLHHPFIKHSTMDNVQPNAKKLATQTNKRKDNWQHANLIWESWRALPAARCTCERRGWGRGQARSRSTAVGSSERPPLLDPCLPPAQDMACHKKAQPPQWQTHNNKSQVLPKQQRQS